MFSETKKELAMNRMRMQRVCELIVCGLILLGVLGGWYEVGCRKVALAGSEKEQTSGESAKLGQGESADSIQGEWSDPFSLPGRQSILEEAHFGIVNGKITVGIPFKQVAGLEGLWAPPYVSSDFRLVLQAGGPPIVTEEYVWHPMQVRQQGRVKQILVQSQTVLAAGKRAGVIELAIENQGDKPVRVPLAFCLSSASLDRTEIWEFATATSRTPTAAALEEGTFLFQQGELAIVLRASPIQVDWDLPTRTGTATIAVPSGGRSVLYLVWAIGPRQEASADCRTLAADPSRALRQAQENYRRRVEELFERVPRLESSNKALEDLYCRSLVHLITNRWDVPDFILNPYYSTGSVRGGCVCSYLWNFGEVWQILPLFDPQGAREQIRQYFRTDITRHFAFMPVTGKAFGPLYPVNQEKIIGLVYFYVKITGDKAFLRTETAGKTTLQHVLDNALYGDDLNRPVDLIDYGPSNSHLELRREYSYNHVMPDLNGRRYQNYLWAAELADLEGQKTLADQLRQRAAALKTLLKQRLWNPQTGWFDFIDGQGRKQTRYTVQMFKLFGSGVLDAEQEAALLAHLNNPKEFLSEFGLHSLAKTDPAYDPADIDNGGPGACTCFPPQIAQRLYQAGHPESADNILRRILWWGQRMPYWGDSLVAERIDYRHDTPLQCTIDGATVAQCLIFGLFGIQPQWDGSILVKPSSTRLAERVILRGVRVQGEQFDVILEKDRFQVVAGGQSVESPVGQAIHLEKGRLRTISDHPNN